MAAARVQSAPAQRAAVLLENVMALFRAGLIVALSALAAAAAQAQSKTPRAVIELFTSQGCSSCPAADRLLGEFANDPSVIAMSLPIDYWDYLGWKDTLANPRHSARQRSYAKVRGDREVYTPQVVVNGLAQAPGSDKSAIERAVEQTRTQPDTLALPISLSFKEGRLLVGLPNSGIANGGAEVWLCALAKQVPVTIPRGENRGRTISYHNVVRRWVKLGDWNGAAQNRTIAGSEFAADGTDAVAVLVQTGSGDKPGKMIGAALAGIR
jgi:hypothetical protein